jgi:septal ring factor EnvC (AmiA/AmiB activator)
VEQVKSDTSKSTKNNLSQLNQNSSKIDKEDKLGTDSTISNEKSPPKVKVVSIRPFIAPVVGNIVNYYSQNKGNNNNNGIDYETTVFENVNAVSDGTVVLISDIVGGSGKIMLIRHQKELITIYGRLTNVTVNKGQKVNQGEKVGEVMLDPQTQKGLMHFEVRKGMKSIDPTTMIR